MLSATKEVRRLSIEPNTARIKAASTTMRKVSPLNIGMMNDGKPVGISPKMGAPVIIALVTVPMINAANGAGTNFPKALGHLNTITSVIMPSARATKFGSSTELGIAANAGIVPPPSGS